MVLLINTTILQFCFTFFLNKDFFRFLSKDRKPKNEHARPCAPGGRSFAMKT
jgi:hypothetical protein